MTNSPPQLEDLISHRLLGRVLQPEDISGEFLLIRQAWEATGKPLPTPADFAFVGRGCGSHLLKLISARASAGQSVLRFEGTGANHRPSLVPSIDAKKARVGKIVFRLFEVAGSPSRHLVEHILNPDDISGRILDGFAMAFGVDALEALRHALSETLTVTNLPAAEFPIIFLPRPGGGDLQATPLAPAEAYVRMEEVLTPYFRKREEGRAPPPRGRWHRQEVSAKPQNISAAIGRRRTRFMAEMPRVLTRWEAMLHSYAKGGAFPRWRNDEIVQAVLDYAALLSRSEDYSNQDIRRGLDLRSDNLIKAAQIFVGEVVDDARASFPDAELRRPPQIQDLLWLGQNWPNEDARQKARKALTSSHFKDRLSAISGG